MSHDANKQAHGGPFDGVASSLYQLYSRVVTVLDFYQGELVMILDCGQCHRKRCVNQLRVKEKNKTRNSTINQKKRQYS